MCTVFVLTSHSSPNMLYFRNTPIYKPSFCLKFELSHDQTENNKKHMFLKILLKTRTKLHFFILRISKRTTSFYFLFLQNSPNFRDRRFPCTLTHTIMLFAYIGYNKRAPLTISSSQCHIPHIEISGVATA